MSTDNQTTEKKQMTDEELQYEWSVIKWMDTYCIIAGILLGVWVGITIMSFCTDVTTESALKPMVISTFVNIGWMAVWWFRPRSLKERKQHE
jgi:hypothetical protein